MSNGGLSRRRWLAATAGGTLAAGAGWAGWRATGQGDGDLSQLHGDLPVRWVGQNVERGHHLRDTKSGALPPADTKRRVGALVVGGGVAGLSALRRLVQAGVADAQLIELDDHIGGNSRGHDIGGLRCPLGAHYLPVPGEAAVEVREWLHEIGLLRYDPLRGVSLPDERHLCHAPQERLFIDGHWQEGTLASAEDRPGTLAQYRRFGALVAEARRTLGFSIPTARSLWTPGHAALDAQTFAAWLAANGLDDERLLAFLDYVCRDDYGAGIVTVSAWAGLQYFAARGGFHAPGDAHEPDPGVFTWPEGNGWLVDRLAAPLRDRLHTGRVALRVDEGRHEVTVTAWNATSGQMEQWTAPQVVLAVPVFVAARVWVNAPTTLRDVAARVPHAPWLVANLRIDTPLIPRTGAPPAWDNVAYAPAGSTWSLGYVDASHQSLRPVETRKVLTAYWALPTTERPRLYRDDARTWLQRLLPDLINLHADLPGRIVQADLMRYGHAMAVPAVGVKAALATLRGRHSSRIALHHADLAGYSVFEEAFGVAP